MTTRKRGFYEKVVKRGLDFLCALLTVVLLGWLFLILALLVRLKMGSPVIFRQPRPGQMDPDTGQEKIFNMYKFRTMTDRKDENGNLLPDERRLTSFGRFLRASSLDELPEMFNILRGDISLVGPRPMLVRDLVFMSPEVRRRHTVKPGLTGLAQVNGRNAISWEQKYAWDLKYIEKISFGRDFAILGETIWKVFGKKESSSELEIADDYGDALLKAGKVCQEEYETKQEQARQMILEFENGSGNLVS